MTEMYKIIPQLYIQDVGHVNTGAVYIYILCVVVIKHLLISIGKEVPESKSQ